MGLSFPRQIIEEESFDADKRNLMPDAKRLDEVLEGVMIRLCRDAESGTNLPGSDLYVTITLAYPDAPALGVTYRFDNDHVYLIGVELD
jgi:hypothetical protein